MVAFSLIVSGGCDAGDPAADSGRVDACAPGVGAAYLVIYLVEQDRKRPGLQ
jgi:hypothetical protein